MEDSESQLQVVSGLQSNQSVIAQKHFEEQDGSKAEKKKEQSERRSTPAKVIFSTPRIPVQS